MPQLNEGARALVATNKSLADIARACGVSRSSVSRWKRGIGVPFEAQRESLRDAFGIPPDAWGDLPRTQERTSASKKRAKKKAAGSLDAYPEPPDDDASIVENLRYSLKCIRHELRFGDLTTSGRSKLRSDEARTLALIAKLQREEELSEDRYVKKHPAFRAHVALVLRLLKPYPEASRALVAGLRNNRTEIET